MMTDLPPTYLEIPPLARCSVAPYSAFELGWTYGPITLSQHRTAWRYFRSIPHDRPLKYDSINDVPGYWLNPPMNAYHD